MAKPHEEVTAGVVLLLLCALALWLTTGFDEVPAMLSQNVPPTFFPRLTLTVIALLSVALIVSGAGKASSSHEKIHGRVLVTAAIIVLATLLVAVVGTLITLFLATLALPLAWGERRYFTIMLLAIVLPTAIYLLFTLALGVRFPPGPFTA